MTWVAERALKAVGGSHVKSTGQRHRDQGKEVSSPPGSEDSEADPQIPVENLRSVASVGVRDHVTPCNRELCGHEHFIY